MKKLLWFGLAAALALPTSACVIDDTYTTCRTGADCAKDECLEVTIERVSRGAFCSYGCSLDRDCERNLGFPGVCYSLGGTAPICYQQCDFDNDCWGGNVCIEVDLGGGVVDYICVPDNL